MSAKVQQALAQAIAAAWLQPVTVSVTPPSGASWGVVQQQDVQAACIPIKEWHALITAITEAGSAA